MKRSFSVAVGVLSLVAALLTAAVRAEEPAKKANSVKPPWQRMLQGADAKKAAEQEKKLEQLQEAGPFAEALKVAEALAELRAKAQGTDHWQVTDARFDVEAIRYVLDSKMEEQESYIRSFALQREADALVAKGHYRQAQPLLERVLAIRSRVLGEEHPYTAVSYLHIARNLQDQVKYDKAEKAIRKALAICHKVLGEEHPTTASCYATLAGNLKYQGKYVEAEKPFRTALAIYREVLTEEDQDVATSYFNLAGNLIAQGKYAQAEENYRKALVIRLKIFGEEHQRTGIAYDNLSLSLLRQGKYAEAQVGFQKGLAILRKANGEAHPYTAISYNNAAMNLSAQGKYTEAEACLRKALAICREALGEDNPYTIIAYNNLGGILDEQGKYKEAEEVLEKALVISRTVLDEEHPDTALCYNNLAANLKAQDKYKKAEESSRKALAIRRKVLGEEHPDTANSYHNVGFVLDAQGEYTEAEKSYRKALAIRRKLLVEEHPDTRQSYDNLAYNLNEQGKYKEAEKYWLLAADVFANARLHVAATGLERVAFSSKSSPLPPLAAILARNGKPDDAWQRFEESLARGTWDDLSARLSRPQAERDQLAQITARIERLNKLIERTSAVESTNEQTKQREQRLTELRQAYGELAAFTQELEKKHGPIAGQVFPRGQIQETLAKDTALIAWLDIAGQPKAADPNGEHWAVLLRSAGDPIWVRLSGSGDKNAWIDADTQLPAQLRVAVQKASRDWQPLAQRLRKQRLDPLAQHLKGVRRIIVLPSTALAGVPIEAIAEGYTVSYAHSGTMYAHLLRQSPPTSKGLFVLADPVFDAPKEKEKPQPLPPSGVLLTVVAPGSNAAKAGIKSNDVLLRYGDTELNKPTNLKLQPESRDPKNLVSVVVWRDGKTMKQQMLPGKLGVVIAKEPAPQAVAEQRRMDRLLASRGGDDGSWPRLPGTRVEAASLQRLFGSDSSQILLDSEASEQRLNELAQRGELGKYRYIHLATHGEVNDTFPLRSAVILSRDHLPDDKQRTELLVSGQPIPDGRLEAEEALRRWNLHSDLVTLSACETALGKYERGEGFVGFAQSLILCGTRSVCLSLWKVDDTVTALLMERFYQNLLGKRDGLKAPLPKAAALTEAKTWLRNLPREEAVKRAASLTNGVDRGKRPAFPPLEIASASAPGATVKSDCPFAHPYYWAAFVLVGHAD